MYRDNAGAWLKWIAHLWKVLGVLNLQNNSVSSNERHTYEQYLIWKDIEVKS
jgi:hypothetical protein